MCGKFIVFIRDNSSPIFLGRGGRRLLVEEARISAELLDYLKQPPREHGSQTRESSLFPSMFSLLRQDLFYAALEIHKMSDQITDQ